MASTGTRRPNGNGGQTRVFRWECPCREPPVLLATYDRRGRINIKVRDRYWHVRGQVQAICPRCGAEHVLDLRQTGDGSGGDGGVLAAGPTGPRRTGRDPVP
jgi:hypothetical protein